MNIQLLQVFDDYVVNDVLIHYTLFIEYTKQKKKNIMSK